MKWWKNRNSNTMHMKDTMKTQRQNKERGTVNENVRKISLQLCNITFQKKTFSGSQNVAGRQTGRQAGRQTDRQADRVKVIGTFLQDLLLQIC